MKKILFCIALVGLSGCATLWDAPAGIVGYSTRELERGRVDSIYQSYEASSREIFQAVLDIAQENLYSIFMKQEARGLIVLMNVPGAVDTTEVGVFITEDQAGTVKVELSSQSTPAKRTVALTFFGALDQKFKKI